MNLFMLKFAPLSAEDIKKFLEINNLQYTPLNVSELNELKENLYETETYLDNTTHLNYYKVPFTKVLDLVRDRKCFLKGGFAYVGSNNFISIIAHVHEQHIKMGLKATYQSVHRIETDDRILKLIQELHKWDSHNKYVTMNNTPIECLDQLSKNSFPLCMRTCHETLRKKHHHKYDGRLQYGSFLLAIGVTLEDSIQFWQDEFTKIMDLDRFNAQYVYNIKHMYGKVGSGIIYSPWSCGQTINSHVGPQHTHGCPFKTLNSDSLKRKLASYGLNRNQIQEIIAFSSDGSYRLACSRYFEITLDVKLQEPINYPHLYFELHHQMANSHNRDTCDIN